MIQTREIAFSIYAVTDMTRARAFYEGVAMVSDPDGNTVCIHKRNSG